jgi:RimJ/RimL family protein N-acetyltransferase
VVSWGDHHFAGRRTVCIIHPDNQRSFRVAEKLGYKMMFSAKSNDVPSAVLARTA